MKRVAGMMAAVTSVARRLPRKSSRTKTASRAPISTASRTLVIASRIRSDWLYQMSTWVPAGRSFLMFSISALAASTDATVFASGWRETVRRTDSFPPAVTEVVGS